MAIGKIIEGIGFRLRPVKPRDASFVLLMRNDPDNARFLPPIPGTVNDQSNWINEQQKLAGDYYFVVESRITGEKVGLTGLYAHMPDQNGGGTIEWGRFVVDQRSLAATETSLLSHRFAFDILGVADVFGYSIEGNQKVISFHQSCGLEERGMSAVTYKIEGVEHKALCFGLSRENWPEFAEKLGKTSAQVAQILGRKHRS